VIRLLRHPRAFVLRKLTLVHLNALREAGFPELCASLNDRLADSASRMDLIEKRLVTLDERSVGNASRMELIEKRLVTLDERSVGSASRMELIEKRLVTLDERSVDTGLRLGLVEKRGVLICDILSALVGRQVVPLETGFLAVRTPVGWIVLPDTEIATLLHLADGRNTQEPGTVRFVQDQLPHDGQAIDVGAHVGMLTIPMARAVAPLGTVDALEPFPSNAAALRRTIVANSLEVTVQVHEAAADSSTGTAQFVAGANGQLGALVGPESAPASAIEVATVCLDDIRPPGSRIDVVKIDAEGAELRVLAGMRRIIADNPGLVVVAEFGPSHLRARGVTTKEWFEAFAQAGLRVATEIDEAARTVTPLRPADALDRVYSINIAFSASLEALAPPNRAR
jgi:FkbM family methyltransferase